ncbi:hypothetical protein J2W83_001265 [Pseudomonas hunanensis]|uniref:Uncharacterized protein n=1 Tax=Pseudomonas hunanensis TaxID=1247546 RepID=A0ACC6JZS2_9PSED|nr:OprD family porin [Pseudomonas hunanensis]MDR6711671.1 hypothetical protein [Pseudomonas hunanensis]
MRNASFHLGLSAAYLGLSPCISSAVLAEGFVEDSVLTINTRNVYFARDYKGSDVKTSKRAEWAQGFILQGGTGYTPGTLGVGLDVLGQFGVKLDSGKGRAGTGLIPNNDSGPADNFGRLGGVIKLRGWNSEMKYGEQILNLPILRSNDGRLLPQTQIGTTLRVAPSKALTVHAGRIESFSGRDSTNQEPLHMHGSSVTGKHFDYVGGEWQALDRRLQLGYWHAELKDIYRQDFYRFAYQQPWGNAVMGFDSGLYVSAEQGQAKAGELDNRALYLGLRWSQAGHTFLLGYQRQFGDDDFVALQDSGTLMTNHANNIFAYARERSWQVRYDYDFAAQGIPGLSVMTRYIRGDHVQRSNAESGHEWERDASVRYVVQAGQLRDLGVALNLSTLRSTFQSSFDELRVMISYPITLL